MSLYIAVCPVCRQEVEPIGRPTDSSIEKHDDTVGHHCTGSGQPFRITETVILTKRHHT